MPIYKVGPYTRRGQAWIQFLKKERRPYAASGRSLYDSSAWGSDSGARPVFLQHHPNGTSFLSTKLDPPYTLDSLLILTQSLLISNFEKKMFFSTSSKFGDFDLLRKNC